MTRQHSTISKELLEKHYLEDGKSMQQIADLFECSLHKIVYHMQKHSIPIRSRSEAIYKRKYPHGDPFTIKKSLSGQEKILYGLGIGLFWGEGNKVNEHSVRLGNTDPKLIKTFILFLEGICGVNRNDLKFGLQLFSDINPDEALSFWKKELGVQDSQFYKTTVTISGAIGTYRRKSKYGVLTIYYNNSRLRNYLIEQIQNLPR